MTVPTRADIVAGNEHGTLLDSIFQNPWGCRYDEYEGLAETLAACHNSGEVDLLKLLRPHCLDSFQNHVRDYGLQIYGRLLGKLNTPAEPFLHALGVLFKADGAESYTATDALATWCAASQSRPLELLNLIDGQFPGAASYHCLAISIQYGLKVDTAHFSGRAYEFLSSGENSQRVDVVRAFLAAPLVEEAEWRKLLGVFQTALARETSEEIRGAILKTVLSWFQSAPPALAEAIHSLVIHASTPTTATVAREMAYALAFSFKDLASTVRESLLTALYPIDPDVDTLNLVDLGLAHFIEIGDGERARNYLETLILREGRQFSFSNFDSVIRKLHEGQPEGLDEWVVAWLNSGSYRLCQELDEGLFDGKDEHRFQIDFARFRLTEFEYCFVARKAIAAFFLKPVTIATFLTSLGRTATPPQTEELQDLLFDPLLINYPSLAEKYLRSVAEDEEDVARPMVKYALARLEDYRHGIDQIGCVPELHPSERERQIEWQRHSDSMTDAMQKGSKQSFLMDLFPQRILLYGNGMVSWVGGAPESARQGEIPTTPPRRIEMELTGFSHQFELPREEVLDRTSLHIKLMSFKLEKLPK
ncbi:hypothetical protein [Pseudomonas putida]|uniref:hypothetical protein n=1 Tax=Pseudomonas putida TaxID=303 RepID=UPI0009809A4C|nr:hypothetical protein [Pseudomonas putida]OMQ29732.1 hypothetical protein BKX96_29945 [Pseudomonas putida]